MYGFPTQTVQDTVDALEYVRQLFAAGCIQSGFFHRFACTVHSPAADGVAQRAQRHAQRHQSHRHEGEGPGGEIGVRSSAGSMMGAWPNTIEKTKPSSSMRRAG